MKDFVGLSRCIVNHWIYDDAEYFKAWFEMIYRARYGLEPEKKIVEGQLIEINRGEFIFGRKSWSERLKVSERRLRTLIDKLLKENMIQLVMKYNKCTVYRVVNYDLYNSDEKQKNDQQNDQQQSIDIVAIEDFNDQRSDHQATTERPSSDHQATTQEERENRKERKKDIIILTESEEKFISVLKTIENYPVDLNKDKELFNTLTERYPALDLIQAVKDWAVYKEDAPLKPKCNARSQINTSFKKYVEWGRCLKTVVKSSNKVDIKKTAAIVNAPPENIKDWVE